MGDFLKLGHVCKVIQKFIPLGLHIRAYCLLSIKFTDAKMELQKIKSVCQQLSKYKLTATANTK